jgi:hypothetical protein
VQDGSHLLIHCCLWISWFDLSCGVRKMILIHGVDVTHLHSKHLRNYMKINVTILFPTGSLHDIQYNFWR